MERIGFVTVLAALLACACGVGADRDESSGAVALERVEVSGDHMGTRFRVVVYAPDAASGREAASGALDRVRALDARLSDYDPESELSRLSRTAGSGEAFRCSEDLWRVLVAAQRFAEATGGAFDATAGPLVRQWRRAARQGEVPESGDLARARSAVGWRSLRLEPEARSALLVKPGMRLDLGGIAKGFALDEALAVLSAAGIERALVDGGGDVALLGSPPDGGGWTLALQDPRAGAAPLACQLSGGALATSGPAYRASEIDGVRYSHLIDPRTGQALTRAITVSVRAPDGMTADAVASAVSVLGAEAGLTWVETLPSVEACVWEAGKADGEPCLSSGFPRTMLPPAAR